MVTPTIFSPGETCGGIYSITNLHARSPVADSYLARHRKTDQEVILTCSRLDHDEGARLRPTFLVNAAMLRATPIEDAPTILDAGLNEGIYWVAREHIPDGVPLWDALSAALNERPAPPPWELVTKISPWMLCIAVCLRVGVTLSRTLGAFASKRILHGGLNLKSTIAVRAHGDPILLETGYAALFGLDHLPIEPDVQSLRPPERAFGCELDERSDIYSLGISLSSVLTMGTLSEGKLPPPALFGLVSRMSRNAPQERMQSWREVSAAFEEYNAAFDAKFKELAAPISTVNPPASGELPASGERSGLTEDSADTDSCPPPAESGERRNDPVRMTSASGQLAAPTPRVPELPAMLITASRPPPSCSVVEAPVLDPCDIDVVHGESPVVQVIQVEAPSFKTASGEAAPVEPPSARKRTSRTRRQAADPLAIAAIGICLIAILGVFSQPARYAPDVLTVQSGAFTVVSSLRQSELAAVEPAAPASPLAGAVDPSSTSTTKQVQPLTTGPGRDEYFVNRLRRSPLTIAMAPR